MGAPLPHLLRPPHPDEGEVQPLDQAVPYLYARAIGLQVQDTDWHDLGRTPEDRCDEHGHVRPEFRLAIARTAAMIEAMRFALHADALLRGMSGAEAWEWAERYAVSPDILHEITWEFAVHYGVPVDQIKPYPVIAEPAQHWHHDRTGNATGSGIMTRIDCPESECEACTEEIPEECSWATTSLGSSAPPTTATGSPSAGGSRSPAVSHPSRSSTTATARTGTTGPPAHGTPTATEAGAACRSPRSS